MDNRTAITKKSLLNSGVLFSKDSVMQNQIFAFRMNFKTKNSHLSPYHKALIEHSGKAHLALTKLKQQHTIRLT